MTLKRIGSPWSELTSAGQVIPTHRPGLMTIPSSFQVLDTRIDAADSFCNIRDVKVLQENFNIAIAKRIRRNIMHVALNTVSLQLNGASQELCFPALEAPVLISQKCKEIFIVWRGTRSVIDTANTNSPKVCFVLHPMTGTRSFDVSTIGQSIAETFGATAGVYDFTVPVPYSDSNQAYFKGMNLFRLCMYTEGALDSTGAHTSNIDTTAYGSNWIETSSEASTCDMGDIFATALSTSQVFYSRSISGGYHLTVSPPWEGRPSVGSNVGTLQHVQGVFTKTISVYELDVSSFTSDVGSF